MLMNMFLIRGFRGRRKDNTDDEDDSKVCGPRNRKKGICHQLGKDDFK